MGPTFIQNLIQSSNESYYKVRWCENQGNVDLTQWLTNQMQLLSTTITTGLETIDILTIKAIRTNTSKANCTLAVNV